MYWCLTEAWVAPMPTHSHKWTLKKRDVRIYPIKVRSLPMLSGLLKDIEGVFAKGFEK